MTQSPAVDAYQGVENACDSVQIGFGTLLRVFSESKVISQFLCFWFDLLWFEIGRVVKLVSYWFAFGEKTLN